VSAALSRRPVFRALTRPQMFAGVTYSFFVLNAAVITELFLITRSFLVLPLAAGDPRHGYLACLREPRVFDLWLARVSRCPSHSELEALGCNSYAP
jgi:type IV secretion system protein VirB3